MEKKNFIFLFTILFINCILPVFSQGPSKHHFEYYKTPDNKTGICTTLSRCPPIGLISSNEYVDKLQKSCSVRNLVGDLVVCCEEAYKEHQSTTTRPPNRSRPTTTRKTPTRKSTTQRFRSSTVPYINPSTKDVKPTSSPSTPEIRANGFCVGPDTRQGTCKALRYCPILLTALSNKNRDPKIDEFLRNSNKICNSTFSFVCCPADEKVDQVTLTSINNGQQKYLFINRLPAVEDGCGQTKALNNKIVGGIDAQLGTWPWIALLGYGELNLIEFKCGGSLITQKHVLTAAHCIRNNLVLVRLGEHDLSTDNETNHVDVRVEKTETHPQHFIGDGYADIALVYFQQPVQFIGLINAICLPKSITLRTKSYKGYSPFVAGWGKIYEGGPSKLNLQQTQIPIHENSVCVDSYKKVSKYISPRQFGNSVLCAGVLSGGKDTCQGDSGGPLVIPEYVGGSFLFYEIGIVSYGVGCARPEIPGVYTSVQHYMDWIEKKVSETR